MTDKELLAFAAKAFGGLEYQEGLGWIERDARGNLLAWWNPRTDDGDSQRLAVRLKMDIYALHDGCEVKAGSFGSVVRGDDLYSATREAIFLTAAEIGKAMP